MPEPVALDRDKLEAIFSTQLPQWGRSYLERRAALERWNILGQAMLAEMRQMTVTAKELNDSLRAMNQTFFTDAAKSIKGTWLDNDHHR